MKRLFEKMKLLLRRKQRFRSIKTKVIFSFVFVTVLSLSFVSVYNFSQSSKVIKDQSSSMIKDNTHRIATQFDLVNNQFYGISAVFYSNTILKLLKSDNNLDSHRASIDYYEVKEDAYEKINQVISNNEIIKSITIATSNGKKHSFGEYIYKDENLTEMKWYKKAISLKSQPFWLSNGEGEVKRDKDTVSYIRSITLPVDGNLGVVKIDVDVNLLKETIGILNSDTNTKIVLLKSNGFSLLDKEKVVAFDLSKLTDHQGDLVSEVNGDKYMVVYKNIDDSDLMLLSYIKMDHLLSGLTSVRNASIISTILSIALSIVIALFISTNITRPIKNLMLIMKSVEKGDLTVKSSYNKNDEIGKLSNSFNNMVQNLSNIVQRVNKSTKDIETSNLEMMSSSKHIEIAARDVNTVVDEIAVTSNELSSRMQVGVTTTQLLSSYINDTMDFADQIKYTANETEKLGDKSQRDLNDVVEIMKNNNEQISRIVNDVNELNEQSKEVETVVNVISEVANQTNLLALNASIEAARAGVHGKGFAVVAEEVKKLSEQVSVQSKAISGIISSITQKVFVITEQTEVIRDSYSIQEGKMNDTSQSLYSIINKVNHLRDQIQQLTNGSGNLDSQRKELMEVISETNTTSEVAAASCEKVSISVSTQTDTIMSLSKMIVNVNEEIDLLKRDVANFKVE